MMAVQRALPEQWRANPQPEVRLRFRKILDAGITYTGGVAPSGLRPQNNLEFVPGEALVNRLFRQKLKRP
jgi:hypothetical protein